LCNPYSYGNSNGHTDCNSNSHRYSYRDGCNPYTHPDRYREFV
jgi:hypothetical protein